MGHRTALHGRHREAGARLVDFAGWEMPIQYRSQIEEHHAVRRAAGAFDVSHMGVVDIEGERATDCLRYLLANDVGRLEADGRALYTCLLNEQGGVLDDLIVYRRDPQRYRTVVNAATREKDLAWMRRHAEAFGVSVRYRDDLAMIAVQGPEARERAGPALPMAVAEPAAALRPFTAAEGGGWFVSRTGYTGEDGYEVILPADDAVAFWDALMSAGVAPCGLGARDTLRLEAGLNLYGQDMDETVTPLESNLGWTVAFEPAERDFIGRDALERQREAGVARKLVGLVLEGRGVLRAHQTVSDGEHAGELTSGSFAPTLGQSIGLARVPQGFGERCEVSIRGRALPARVVRPPFVRHGRPRIG
ncbi:glycine cleavage system aminomethyltransferase GcvT [Spiribacter halobius]|uniref:Aminomethyltransferase n=1 Tax=Sediminicurvatus halobius TaxID=2182432 RepID=A0A2U2N198_9GAMM|nr:glycine cleavage system aminomethyltransferase GcvT [Spiribacter halobius]PWG62966.1 glycine cleavage system aminomethyltransferase GcvT [Spiribacter halobius]UEX77480.1 glycine cleavage system aminomethyltransferase GcvT [Spiribacter halobius]